MRRGILLSDSKIPNPLGLFSNTPEAPEIRADTFFRTSFIAVFCLLTIVRFYYRITTGAIHDKVFTQKEGLWPVIIRWVLGLPLFLATGAYIFLPDRHFNLYLPVPFPFRLSGVLLGLLSVYFIFLVHRELGIFFSSGLVLRDNHKLIRTGPYRFVRHPMYSSYLLLFLSAFLISGNWAVGIFGTAVIASLMTIRLVREEALLLEKFGGEYRDYIRNTGMFIPMTHKLRTKAVKDY